MINIVNNYQIDDCCGVVKVIGNDKWDENTYILYNGNEGYIIDPGFGCQDLCEYIDGKFDIQGILLTHAHHDHLATADYISKKLNVDCVVHQKDYRLLLHTAMYSIRFAGAMVKRPQRVKFYDDCFQGLCDWGVEILHTPGHSHGSVCIFFKNIVFVGDMLVRGKLGRTDLPEGDMISMESSVDSFSSILQKNDIDYIYPGHGEIWRTTDFLEWWKLRKCNLGKNNVYE